MSPKNVSPGAGGARVHNLSSNDAATLTRNQPTAQSNPAARSVTIVVTLSDGAGESVLAEVVLPYSRHWCEGQVRAHVVAVIQENAGGRS